MHEKLERELKSAMVMPLEMIARFLDEECGRDPSLIAKIEDANKTLEKCYRYIEKKAQEIAKSKHSIYIDDPTVYGWAKEYYMSEEPKKSKEEEAEKGTKEEAVTEEKPKRTRKKKKEASGENDATPIPEEPIPGQLSTEDLCSTEKESEVQIAEIEKKEEENKSPLSFEECGAEESTEEEKETDLSKPGEAGSVIELPVASEGASWLD